MTTEGNSGPISLRLPGNLYLVLTLETFYFSREFLSFCKAGVVVFWLFFFFC